MTNNRLFNTILQEASKPIPQLDKIQEYYYHGSPITGLEKLSAGKRRYGDPSAEE